MEQEINERKLPDEEIYNLTLNRLSEQNTLRQAIEEKDKKIKDLSTQLLRLSADFDNYRKRVEEEKKQFFRLGKMSVIEKIIDTVRLFELAKKTMSESENEEVIKGFEMIKTQFMRIIESEGVKEIETMGKKFNPNLHEAVEVEERDDVEENTIIQEIEKGYMFDDAVIKPAKVKVCIKKKQEKEDAEQKT